MEEEAESLEVPPLCLFGMKGIGGLLKMENSRIK